MTLVVGRYRATLRHDGTALIVAETDFGPEQAIIAAQSPDDILFFLGRADLMV